MAVEVKVPAAGESITEVMVAEWLKAEGEAVRQDEPLVTLETDKASLDLPAPAAGVLTRIMKRRGETARVGEVIAVLDEAAVAAGASAPAAPARGARERPPGPSARPRGPDERTREPAAPPAARPPAAPPGDGPERPTEPGERAPAPEARPAPTPPPAPPWEAPRVMPAARRLMAERGVEPEEVTATGPGGRVLKEDVLRHLDAAPETPAPAGEARMPAAGDREEEVVPMSMLRRRVAERLVQAQQAAALLTTFNEVDMSAVIGLRRAHQDAFQQRHQVKLGFMSFFVKAVVEALARFPALNAEIRGTDIVYRNYYDIGIAVGGGRGLVVPVLRSAERLTFAETERAIADFARRAEANQLTLEELQGGTFTISNGGIYGSLLSTPIVNPPQSGILGLHAIQDRPMARDGQVVIRPMMYVALTYDHRVVDGREAVTFLRHVTACIEEPARILLEV
jgi:2-oxoglutarate dehydrogenase E2 component (dihydrolipoamide succinyltransferase)